MSVCDITSPKAKAAIQSVLDYLERNMEKLSDGSKESNDMLKKCELMMANYEAGIIDGLLAFGNDLRGEMNMDDLANGENSLRSRKLWYEVLEGKYLTHFNNWFRKLYDQSYVGVANKFGHSFSHTLDGAARFLEAVGYDRIMRGKSKADKKIQDINNKLAKLQKKMSRASRETVFGETGNFKNGVLAFLMKEDPGNPDNFTNRVQAIIESLEQQKKQRKKSPQDGKAIRLVNQALLSLGVINENGDILIQDRQSFRDKVKALEKSGELDPGHMQVVKFFQDQFAELLPLHQEVSQGVYNHILLPQNDYVPDYTVKTGVKKHEDRASSRAISTERVMDNPLRSPDDKASTNARSKSLQDQQQGKSPSQGGFRYDFDFMENMLGKLEDGYLDVHTADAVRQVNAAVNSDSFETIFRNPDTAESARKKLIKTIDNVRGVNKEMSSTPILPKTLEKIGNEIATISTFRALGTLKQPFQQFIPAIGKLMIMSEMGGGKVFLKTLGYMKNMSPLGSLSEGQIKLLDERSDAQYRGVKSSADINRTNRNKFPEGILGKAKKITYGNWKQLQQYYLDNLLVGPDKLAAKISWLIHYEDYISRKTGKDVDWEAEASSNSKLSRQAAAYANQMVNASLNETHQEAMGGIFSSKNSITQAIRKIFIPFGSMQASLRTNMMSDLSVIFAVGENRTMREEGAARKARKRFAGTLVEQSLFLTLKGTFATMQYQLIEPLLAQIAGYSDFEDEDERQDQVTKQMIQQTYTDILPHLPFMDGASILIINSMAKDGHMDWLMEEINDNLDSAVDTPFFDSNSTTRDLGVYSVATDDINIFGEMLRGALTGTISKDGYFFTGKGRDLSLREQQDCLHFSIIYALSGLATPQMGAASIEKLFKKIKYERENHPRTNRILEFDQIRTEEMKYDEY